MNKPCVLLWTPWASHQSAVHEVLREQPDFELVAAASEAEAIEGLARADAMLLAGVGNGYSAALAQAVHAAPRLRWLQLLSTGQEALEQRGVPQQVTVTGVGNSSAAVVAEHAMALLLALGRRIGEAAVNGQRGRWDRALAARITSLEGMTLCLAGYGRIGKEIAKRAQAFGMRCIAVNRSGRNDAPELADTVYPVSQLREALAQSDAVAISFPLTDDTRSLFGVGEWAACRKGALVVNVGRGATVDTDALVGALHSGHIAGAGLDVTDPEPLPDGHPLWTAPGALITPHIGGGGSTAGLQRLGALVLDNVRRFRAGAELQHRVELA
ncbi:D-2-hydroxyacid dehydrogenase [Ramlibacter sp. G-1-2-2]|uniref:D-2-hydroxyacid dehydrogenase n=1 Tax=Ramlibacter agri TaxID=2728837 RepID=A0A848H8A4_9BURK|nr:D-2-hydroxyacid dehydrogenase [Ramlibacter agri]NML46182.1 D-2-hydroxyacid dehydrogenase [Ramlibacter agri]